MASTSLYESSAEDSSLSEQRLGLCEACNANVAKYTCPRCEVKTCSLECLNLHKKELKCDGIRDRTKYIPLVKMTKMDLMNDYYFLEECTKFVEDRKRDHRKRFTCYKSKLPTHMIRLRQAATDRETVLRFLLQNFSKRQKNTSYLDYKSGKIFWRIEWCFPEGKEKYVYVDENVCEDSKLYDVVDKYLQPAAESNIVGASKLAYYQSRGITGVTLLLKAEGVKQCRDRALTLNIYDTIREALRGKTIVEFPTIYVVLNDRLDQFNVIDSDDDLEAEMNQYNRMLHENLQGIQRTENINGIKSRLDKMEIEPKQHKKTTNFLFSDVKSLNESSDSDEGTLHDDNETKSLRSEAMGIDDDKA